MIVLHQSLLDLVRTCLPDRQSDSAVVAHRIVLNADRPARSRQCERTELPAETSHRRISCDGVSAYFHPVRILKVYGKPTEELILRGERRIVRNYVIDQPHVLALA